MENSYKWKSIHTAATVSHLVQLMLLYIRTKEQQSQSTKPVTTRGKNFLRKTKGFVDGLSYSTPQKEAKKQRGNAIT